MASVQVVSRLETNCVIQMMTDVGCDIVLQLYISISLQMLPNSHLHTKNMLQPTWLHMYAATSQAM